MNRLPKIYFLTGFMGVGKTYWAKQISQATGLRYYDTDCIIEERAGRTIKAIIREKGLRKFRQVEKECLRKLISDIMDDAVVSLGGGSLLDPGNLELIKQHGTLIWLKGKSRFSDESEIKKRPLYDKEKRKELYLERETSYVKSDHIIDLDLLEENTQIESALIQLIES